jgi:hypothetical protein
LSPSGYHSGYWFQFQTWNYQILHAEFYSAQFILLGYGYAGLLVVFNVIPLSLPFDKMVQTLAIREFGMNYFVNGNA